MEIIVGWVILSFIVAAAAGARGRSGGRWFILALVISPVLALIFVLVIPNLNDQKRAEELADMNRRLSQAQGGGRNPPPLDRGEKPFEPDGVFAGFPYQVAEDGSILAIMQGARVKFGDMDRFIAAVSR